MVKIKLEKNKLGKIIFKLKINKELENNILFKRVLMEAKSINKSRARYNYEVPLRFFMPIFNNTNKEELNIDPNSIMSYLEFSDFYDENYYSEIAATAKYMKKWREEGCPNIYRITIDSINLSISKSIVFKKPEISFDEI